MNKQTNIRILIHGLYAAQKLRIATGNRIVANFKVKLGQAPSEKEETLDAAGKKLLKDLRATYKLITDGVIGALPTQRKFKGTELINSYIELMLVDQYMTLEQAEETQFLRLKIVLEDYPIYTQFLEGVAGVGPAMAGVILSEIDIHKAEYPSSLWKYAGLDVAADGRGRSRKAEHLVKVNYKDSEGKDKERNSITFNPFLKTKLIGVLGPSLVKQVAKEGKEASPYRVTYDNYKHRLQNMPAHSEKSDGHINNMAIRYMVKRFLVDLYVAWRALEGLPVADEYSVAKLGMVHKVAT